MVIGTPGRVLAMLDAGYIDPSALRTLVLDEADTLLNMGFEEEARRILPLPTAHCLLCPLPTAYCACCLLPTAYCLLPTAHCPLLTNPHPHPHQVHRIIKHLPSSSSGGDALRRQTLLFSATWPAKVETPLARALARGLALKMNPSPSPWPNCGGAVVISDW